MQPKVSVIVAVYKAEKYIRRCLDSLLKQRFEDFEVILIDDGSPDCCGEICDEYAAKDSRFRVFHQNNYGVATARQRGIIEACGEYSIHVDPDDWVTPDFLLLLYELGIQKDADIIICDFVSIDSSLRQTYRKQNINDTTSDLTFCDLLMDRGHVVLWNKLIKHSMYKKYDVKHNRNLITSEDFYILCQLFTHNLKIAYLPKSLYYYDYSNENSLTKQVSEAQLQSQIFCIDYIERHYTKDIFQQGILFRKMKLKRWMWNSRYFGKKSMVEVYKSVNKEFETDRIRHVFHSDIYYGLNGCYFLGRFMQMIFHVVSLLMSQIKVF